MERFLGETNTTYEQYLPPEPGGIGIKMGPYNAALHRRRTELGFTLKDIATAVGYKTPVSISQFETLRAFPKPEIAQKIADFLQTTPDQIFPEYLKLFTRDKKHPAQTRVELTSTEIDRAVLSRALRVAGELEAIDPEEEIEREDLRIVFEQVFKNNLFPRQELALRLRFGLNDDKEFSLDAIGKALGVTDSRAGQIIEDAIYKIRIGHEEKSLLNGYVEKDRSASFSEEALMNGVINALQSGDKERALRNLAKIEQSIASRRSGYIDFDRNRNIRFITIEMLAKGEYHPNSPDPKIEAQVEKLKEIWRLKERAQPPKVIHG